jgi:replication factor C large subunit
MFDKMHVSRRVAVSMFPYLEIMFQNDELAWEISDFLELEENEIKRFRKKKIPKKVINKMEKQKAQMRVEERDRRAEELKNQMMNAVPEVEEIQEDELPFENSGIEEIPKEETPEEPEVVEEPEIVEEEKVEEKKEKKADKQTTLFSF